MTPQRHRSRSLPAFDRTPVLSDKAWNTGNGQHCLADFAGIDATFIGTSSGPSQAALYRERRPELRSVSNNFSPFRYDFLASLAGRRADPGALPRDSVSALPLFSSIQQDEWASASTVFGIGAPSKAEIFRGAQQELFSRLRSVRITLSSLSTASVSRRILAAPVSAGTTIL
jgi:hypothetical protein